MPGNTRFLPRGTAASSLEEVLLSLDEFEAIRLADLEGLYQEQAASRMNVSRQTFGRIIESAHRKVADVLANGKALRIEGGDISVSETQQIRCHRCRHMFSRCCGTEDAQVCPHCRKQAENSMMSRRRRS
jgi:predicted DNA-binding protein (UPF0251 family)